MKLTPLIFQNEMIRALLNTLPGTWPPKPIDPRLPYKWQTMRPMRVQPDGVSREGIPYVYKEISVVREHAIEHAAHPDGEPHKRYVDVLRCPYGAPGDRLWSKEALYAHLPLRTASCGKLGFAYACYDADAGNVCGEPGGDPDRPAHWKWQRAFLPAVFQPRWASRFLLEIVDVRARRAGETSEEDAVAEGFQAYVDPFDCTRIASAQEMLASAWNAIWGERYPWKSTWVWSIQFKILPGRPYQEAV